MSDPSDDERSQGHGEPQPLTEAQQALVHSVGGLVESRVAWHLSRTPTAVHLADDLVSIGKREVIETSRRYSPKFGATFKTYVRYALDGAIVDAITRESRQQSFKVAAEASIRYGVLSQPSPDEDALDALEDDEIQANRKLRRALGARAMGAALAFALQLEDLLERQADPERVAALRRLREALKEALFAFPERDREMLRCLYAEGMDLGEVAAKLGLAYVTVKVRHARLLGKLREALTSRGFGSSGGE